MSQITLKSVTYKAVSGTSNTLYLHAPVVCDNDLPAHMISRLVIPRLPLSPTACLLFGLLVDEVFIGLSRQHSYAGLGGILGKGTHTAIRAVAELRKAGLVATTRVGVRSNQLLFICDGFVTWAESVSTDRVKIPDVARPAPAATTSVPVPVALRVLPSADEAMYGKPEHFASDDHPDWPEVPANWRHVHKIPLPENDDWLYEYCIPAGTKPWLGPVPRRADGRFDEEMLRRKPHQLYTPEEFDGMLELVHADEEAERRKGVEIVEDEPPVDASAEREAELRLAGPQADDSSEEEFRFDSGADTAETDIGRGVKANPDL